MDPLSVSASIAGLLAVATGVAKTGFRLAKTFIGAEKEVLGLMSEVTNLIGVLHSLHFMITQFDGQEIEGATQIYHIHSCYATLGKIKTILSKCDPTNIPQGSGSITSFKRRARWPLSVSETKTLMQEVERQKSSLSLAVNADGMTALLRSLQKQDHLADKMTELQAEANAARKSRVLAALTQKRRAVLDFFGKVDPHKINNNAIKLRHPGTGVWFLESQEFKSWISNENAKLWLNGIRDINLRSTIIAELKKLESENIGLVYFYCDYKNTETRIPANILGSLIRQLAIQHELAFQDMESFWVKYAPDAKRQLLEIDGEDDTTSRLPRQSTDDQRGIKEPVTDEDLVGLLQQMSRHFKDVMVIVDGIDECGEFQGAVARTFSTIIDPDIATLKIILASRDEYEIRSQLIAYDILSISAQSIDVRLYVESEIESRIRQKRLRLRDESLRDYMVEELINRAKGKFQWVKCQLDHLCQLPNDRARRKALESLPPTLHATYERILDRVNASNVENQKLVEKVLRWVICAKTPLSLFSIAEIVSVEDGDTRIDQNAIPTEEDILHWCGSLLRKDHRFNTLEPSHYSVVEFLKELPINPVQTCYSRFSVRPDSADKVLAIECLRYLTLADFATGYIYTDKEYKVRIQEHPFFLYAVDRWDEHAAEHLDDDLLFNLICGLFRPSKKQEFLSWSQQRVLTTAYAGDRYSVESLDTCDIPENSKDVSTLHFAAALALGRVVRWLLEFEGNVDTQSSLLGTPLCCAAQGEAIFTRILGIRDTQPHGKVTWRLKGRMATAKMLIDAGADMNYSGINGHCPLSYTIVYAPSNDLALLDMLIKEGALCTTHVITTASEVLNSQSLQNFVDLVSTENIPKGERNEIVKLLDGYSQTQSLRRLFGDNEDTDESGPHGMHLMSNEKYSQTIQELARWGQLEALEELYDNTREERVMTEKSNYTALHCAVRNSHLQIVQFLVMKGASLIAQDESGNTALHLACEYCQDEIVQYIRESFLARGLDIAAKNSRGSTPLMIAAQFCSTTMFLQMLEDSEDDLFYTDSLGYTVLHKACQSSDIGKMEPLLKRGLKVQAITLDGWTTLMVAVASVRDREFNDRILTLLVDHGCDVNHPAEDGTTLFNRAIPSDFNSWFPSCTGKLLQSVCNLKGISFDHVSTERSTPTRLLLLLLLEAQNILHGSDTDSLNSYTSSKTNNEGANEIKSTEILAGLGLLLTCGFPVDFPSHSSNGMTCLQEMCGIGYGPLGASTVELLLKHGASIDLQDSTGMTAVDHALLSDAENVGILEFLFSRKPDLETQDQLGRTILHRLFLCPNKIDMFILAERLLSGSPNLQIQDIDGVTSLIILMSNPSHDPAIVALLLSKICDDCLLEHSYRGMSLLSLSISLAPNMTEDIVMKILDQTKDVEARDRTAAGRTPLHWVSLTTLFPAAARQLLSQYSNPSLKDHHSCDPLHYAVRSDNEWMVHELLAMNVDLENRAMLKNQSGYVFADATALLVSLCNERQDNKLALIESLIEAGADVEAKTNSGWGLVHFCAKYERDDVLHLLTRTSLDLGSFCTLGRGLHGDEVDEVTALHIAAGFGCEKSAQVLLESKFFTDVNIVTKQVGNTPLHEAAIAGRGDMIRFLLNRGVDKSLRNKDGLTAELAALARGRMVTLFENGYLKPSQHEDSKEGGRLDPAALEVSIKNRRLRLWETLLLEEHVSVNIPVCNSLGKESPCAPLNVALKFGVTKLAHLFLKHGAEVRHRSCTKSFSLMPLEAAANLGELSLLKSIFQRYPLTLDSEMLNEVAVAIYVAIYQGHIHCVRLLYEDIRVKKSRASILVAHRPRPDSVLQVAVARDRKDIVEYLLDNGADVDLVVGPVGSALHTAAERGNLSMTSLLCRRGAYTQARDGNLGTPLHRAAQAQSGGVACAKLLLENGANIHIRDRNGESALAVAVRVDNLEFLTQFMSRLDWRAERTYHNHLSLLHIAMYGSDKCAEFLIENRADILQLSSAMGYPIHCAAWAGNVTLVKALLELIPLDQLLGCLEYSKQFVGTALYNASCQGHGTIVEMLLDAGVSIDQWSCLENNDVDGTALMVACSYGNTEVVRLLLSRGAQIRGKSDNGHTINAMEAGRPCAKVVRILQAYEGDVYHGCSYFLS